MQEARLTLPSQSQIQELFVFQVNRVNRWGVRITKKQVAHLLGLLHSDEAKQLTVTLRPDVVPEFTLDGVEVFSLYRAVNSIPDDPQVAVLYQHPLVDYYPTSPSLATRLAQLTQAARTG
ncbi:MAG: hypothetical protein ABIH36_02655 [bacterium]